MSIQLQLHNMVNIIDETIKLSLRFVSKVKLKLELRESTTYLSGLIKADWEQYCSQEERLIIQQFVKINPSLVQ